MRETFTVARFAAWTFACVGSLTLCALIACNGIRPSFDGSPLPYPPGIQPPNAVAAFSKTVSRSAIRETVVVQPTITIYNDAYDWGGTSNLLIRVGLHPGRYSEVYVFNPTNTAFGIPLNLSHVSFLVESAIYILPAPLTNDFTNDIDGSVYETVTTFTEGPPSAELMFVPTNCPTICLADYTDHTNVVAWCNAGVLYGFQQSPDLSSWATFTNLTGTNGPEQVPVPSGDIAFFRWTTATN